MLRIYKQICLRNRCWETDLDLNYEEDIRITDSREEHWRDVAEDGEDTSKINAMRWDIYTKEKAELIKRYFLVSVNHPKEGNIVLTCVKDNVTKGKEDYEAIGIRGFDYKLSEEEEGGDIK